MPPYEMWWHGGWWFMWIIPLGFLIVIAIFLLRDGSISRWGAQRNRDGGRDSARNILARRFASGELTKDQYEDMKRMLER